MRESKETVKEIISAWGVSFADHLDKMVLENLAEWLGEQEKPRGIPTLTGRISKIKAK